MVQIFSDDNFQKCSGHAKFWQFFLSSLSRAGVVRIVGPYSPAGTPQLLFLGADVARLRSFNKTNTAFCAMFTRQKSFLLRPYAMLSNVEAVRPT